MANVVINDTNLMNIADAIREKNGTEDTYKPSEMAEAILAIQGGGGDNGKINYVATGDCKDRFRDGILDFLILDDQIKNSINISTSGITNAYYMFYGNEKITEIPFELNFDSNATSSELYHMFGNCISLETMPVINNGRCGKNNGFEYMFFHCHKLKSIPNDFIQLFDTSGCNSGCSRNHMFAGCHSLRNIPVDIFEEINGVGSMNRSKNNYPSAFYGCYALDQLVNLPSPSATNFFDVYYSDSTYHYNLIVTYCSRLKRLKFKNTDGSKNIANQHLNLKTVGYATDGMIYNYQTIRAIDFLDENAEELGLVKVVGEATYNQYKNTNDWYTSLVEYSRYNHDSAVETINSLPDTSWAVESSGKTNTITFNGASGSATDGGAISNLTADEIAVATNKGWTVSIV